MSSRARASNRHAAVSAAPQDQGQRPRPETRDDRSSALVKDRKLFRLGLPRNMHDQRVEARPVLDREDLGDGAFAGRIAAEPVHGLGRKGDEPACAIALRRGQSPPGWWRTAWPEIGAQAPTTGVAMTSYAFIARSGAPKRSRADETGSATGTVVPRSRHPRQRSR